MGEMEVNHVDEIHEKLNGMIGQRVKVKANMGRTRVVERMGCIKTVHPPVLPVRRRAHRHRRAVRPGVG